MKKQYKHKICIAEIQKVKKIASLKVFIEDKGWMEIDLNMNLMGNLGLYDVIKPNN